MNKYFVHWNGGAWFVKEAAFFVEQGGESEAWGKHWKALYADSIEHARDRAKLQFGVRGENF